MLALKVIIYGAGYFAAALFLGFGIMRMLTFFHVRQEGKVWASFLRWLWWWASNGLTFFLLPDQRMLTDTGVKVFKTSRWLFFAAIAIMIPVVLFDIYLLGKR